MAPALSLDPLGPTQAKLAPPRFLHVLARKLLHNRRQDLPASGAWGLSPAEIYLVSHLDPVDAAKWKPDHPGV
jgi:hypothetical protein